MFVPWYGPPYARDPSADELGAPQAWSHPTTAAERLRGANAEDDSDDDSDDDSEDDYDDRKSEPIKARKKRPAAKRTSAATYARANKHAMELPTAAFDKGKPLPRGKVGKRMKEAMKQASRATGASNSSEGASVGRRALATVAARSLPEGSDDDSESESE